MSDIRECLQRQKQAVVESGGDKWGVLTAKAKKDARANLKELQGNIKRRLSEMATGIKVMQKARYQEDFQEAYDTMIKAANSLSSELSELSTVWNEYKEEIVDFR